MSLIKHYERYAARRLALVKHVKENYPRVSKGCIVFFASLEVGQEAFRQNSTFFYYTGLVDPGIVVTIGLEGEDALWVPVYKGDRSGWMYSEIELKQANAQQLGIAVVNPLGESIEGVEIKPYMPLSVYSNLQNDIDNTIANNGTIFAAYSQQPGHDVEQRFMLERLLGQDKAKNIVDISSIVGQMRRFKDSYEVESLYKAIDISCQAQEAAARSIASHINEAEVQARLEYIITASGARNAFATIVASGANVTTVHYRRNNQELQTGDLVIVDVGAEYEQYCGDISRTYPVSGFFTKRQKEVYELVLQTQDYIAQKAKPGYWLYNEKKPNKSLHHIACTYLADKGYAKYFVHRIGHFLGLDVHDIGDYQYPLQPGDVFTIEPGLYIPKERIGIRIEDDYWMTVNGAICLSEQLPKDPHEIEQLVQQSLSEKGVEE